jgi:uncharacterized protein YeaC (DUF1315 family)
MSNKHFGSAVDDFLQEEGLSEETRDIAVKRLVAWQIEQAMKAQHISKRKTAQRIKTSRTQLDRLLDPNNTSVQLDTLQRPANAVGQRLVMGLEPAV